MGIEIRGIKVPDSVLLMQSCSTTTNHYIPVNAENTNSIDYNRNSITERNIDSFANTVAVRYPREIVIKNGIRIKLTNNMKRSPRNKEKSITDCIVEINKSEYIVGIESTSLILAMLSDEVRHGVFSGKVYMGFKDGICYAISEADYMNALEIDPDGVIRSRKPETTKYEIGRLYTTQSGNTREVYLGKFYTYSYKKSYYTMELLDKPKECYLFIPEYMCTKCKTTKDIVDNLSGTVNAGNFAGYSELAYRVPNHTKTSKVSRVPTDMVFEEPEGYCAINEIVNTVREWTNANLEAVTGPYIKLNTASNIAIYTEPVGHLWDAASINRLSKWLYKHDVVIHNGIEYQGEL